MATVYQFKPKKKKEVPAYYRLSAEEKEIVAKANRALEFINYMQDVEFKRKEERQKYLEELQEFEDTIGGHHNVL